MTAMTSFARSALSQAGVDDRTVTEKPGSALEVALADGGRVVLHGDRDDRLQWTFTVYSDDGAVERTETGRLNSFVAREIAQLARVVERRQAGSGWKRGGRPSIGGRVGPMQLGEELLPRIDEWAARHDVPRAGAVRWLVEKGLDPRHAGETLTRQLVSGADLAAEALADPDQSPERLHAQLRLAEERMRALGSSPARS